ncbi:MAG: hypothetical protein SGARI_000547 [Bacillariaceae sp.]
MSITSDLESTLKKLPELMKKREEELDQREKELDKAQARLEEKYPNYGKECDVVHLNVGGTPILVLRRTLTQVDGSLLASMFSGRWDENLEKDSDGRFFIDQDYEVFKLLISFLRELGSQTENTKPPQPPQLPTPREQNTFNTMLDYFGMTLGVYQFGCYTHVKQPNGNFQQKRIALYPDIEIETDEKTTYLLAPVDSSHTRFVKSFEVTIGSHSTVQVGWVHTGYIATAFAKSSTGNEGVGPEW